MKKIRRARSRPCCRSFAAGADSTQGCSATEDIHEVGMPVSWRSPAQAPALATCSNELPQARSPRFRLLGTGDPVQQYLPVAWRRTLKMLPGCAVCLERPYLHRSEICVGWLLVRVDLWLLFRAASIRALSCFGHTTSSQELRVLLEVDRAPDRGWAPRRKSDLVCVVVDALSNAIDPAKAQRFVDRFWPGHAWTARADFPVPDGLSPFAAAHGQAKRWSPLAHLSATDGR